jgi:hypothetical protein
MTSASGVNPSPEEAAARAGAANADRAPSTAARPRARRSLAGPLLMFLAFGAFYVLPFASRRPVESPAWDLITHVVGIVEARNALAEGQFPVRVAPQQLDGRRFPLFQFYGNFPYTLGAVIAAVPGVGAYGAWKVVTALSIAAGGFYAYRCGVALTRHAWAGLIGGAVFVTAPYLATDVKARFAFTEAVSFCLLPAVFFYSLRAFASPRRARRSVLAGAFSWALMALSHNITFLYGSALIGLLFLTCLSADWRKSLRRMARLGTAYTLGLALSLWYLVPQVRTLPYLRISADAHGPAWTRSFVPLGSLLSPWRTVPDAVVGTPNMGLQVGWAILAAAAVAALWLAVRRRRCLRPGLTVRLLAAWVLALVMVWTPFDFWPYLPRVFYNVQFTYRLLAFTTLWGSLLAAVALVETIRGTRWATGHAAAGGMRPAAGWACLFTIGLAAMPWAMWRHARMARGVLPAVEAAPRVSSQVEDAYRLVPERIARFRLQSSAPLVPVAETLRALRRGRVTTYYALDTQPTVAQLPVLFYPGLLDVRDFGRVVGYGHIDGLLAVEVPAGPHVIDVRFAGTPWANVSSGLAWAGVAVAGGAGLFSRCRRRRSRRSLTSCPPAFPAVAGMLGAACLAAPLTLPLARAAWKRHELRHTLGRVTASRAINATLAVENAFDGDGRTEWAVEGPSPVTVVIARPRPAPVSGLELEPRHDFWYGSLVLEGWQHVRVVFSLGGREVARHEFVLPEAHRQRLQELRIGPPVTADRIELEFRDPVTRSYDGDRHVDPAGCSPGYREIRIR